MILLFVLAYVVVVCALLAGRPHVPVPAAVLWLPLAAIGAVVALVMATGWLVTRPFGARRRRAAARTAERAAHAEQCRARAGEYRRAADRDRADWPASAEAHHAAAALFDALADSYATDRETVPR